MAPGFTQEMAISQTFLMQVHERNYKNGVFKKLITKDTPLLKMFDILISSVHTSPYEKEVLKECCGDFIRRSKLREQKIEDFIKGIAITEKVTEMFDADASSQGIYIPPTLIQTVNQDGSIGKTTTIDRHGNPTETEGGIHCVPPGAPEEFVKKQHHNTKLFTDHVETNSAKSPKDKSSTEKAATSKSAKKQKKDDLDNFAKAFGGLKGAFI
ncbi:hypothetical protein LSUE1_G010066 [Lachnellula suecica]|uniref:Uncharacterized protein n=1 Tax=Lachnellula suecica TaxID=602035 RepID=A0A8T9C0G9_9HELO|nr:hypothetical protein LSUE1_G010066 [Lachnellula suecica]